MTSVIPFPRDIEMFDVTVSFRSTWHDQRRERTVRLTKAVLKDAKVGDTIRISVHGLNYDARIDRIVPVIGKNQPPEDRL